MPTLISQVRSLIAAHRMIAPGAPVVVAVSGGPDSLCLLHVLRALRDELGAALHVAHLDHMIRGTESAADAAFVADLARGWGLPVTVAAADVPELAHERAENLHAAARRARYAFLARVALDAGAQAVAVAHHADDQAETVLLHLLRGAGPEGLRGMRPVVPWEEWTNEIENDSLSDHSQFSMLNSQFPRLIRPLLTVTRAEIERYCAEHGLQPRRDPTNLDLDATRNRIRHDLLPRLIEYNQQVVAALGRTAAVCADEHAFLAEALEAAWPHLARERDGGVEFDGAAWRALHPALQRAALRRAHARLAPGETLSFERVEQARALVGRGVGRRVELPGGVVLTTGYGGFTLGDAPAPDSPQLPFDEAPLPAEGRVELAGGWAIEVARVEPPAPQPADTWEIYLDGDALGGPLLARRRRSGDRLRLSGGSRRAQDLFVDAKVPRALRDAWPIIATAESIVWVPGLRAAPGSLARPGSRNILRVRVARTR